MAPKHDQLLDLGQSVTQLPGIGPARAALLAKLGIHVIHDLLLIRPIRYLDFRRIAQPCELSPGDRATLTGVIRVTGARRTRRRGIFLCEAALQCEQGEIALVWFLPARRGIHTPVKEGERLWVAGQVTEGPRGLQLVHPLIERSTSSASGRMIPIYPLTAGLQQTTMRRCVQSALPALSRLADPVPEKFLRRHNLPTLPEAIYWMHNPPSPDKVEESRIRLAYNEALMMALAVARRRRVMQVSTSWRCEVDSNRLRQWIEKLPYRLTSGQHQALLDVRSDMEQSRSMQRLLHGDVGSGKTTVAMYAIAKAVDNGLQAALLAPTRILAEQHYHRWREPLAAVGCRVCLVLGNQTDDCTREQIEQGKFDVIMGTHAILDLSYQRLGLIVVDENHRFGVEQRARLARRSGAHCLYLTATPIPRSLALMIWGDVDVSVIADKPAGRQPVDTRWILPVQRDAIYRFVRREVECGRQVYIVYPRIDVTDTLVEASETDEGAAYPTTAEAAYTYLRQGPLKGVAIGLLHGRMTAQEQDKVMDAFSHGTISVLVCTTLVEVGVDVPNASVMVIEQADMFGLAQLHQLRGRVGRGHTKSNCFLVANPRTPEAKERIMALRRTDNGFALAEADLRLRGPGEVLGVLQSGYGELEYASLPGDLPMIQSAQVDAVEIMRTDPDLVQPEHYHLLMEVVHRFPSVGPVAG